jgi:hypothetical protein
MPLIRHPKDFGAGLMFAGIGLAAIVIGSSYPVGTAARMGPGYFPRGLGMILIGLGAILILNGLRTSGSPLAMRDIRPLGIVMGSVLVFALTVNYLGLALASALLVVLASTASHEFRKIEAVIAAVTLAVFVVIVFGYGLKLQLPLWPAFLGR